MELDQLYDYSICIDREREGKPPPSFKKIGTYFVYGVKHYGRHKERYVAGRHNSGIALENVYSGVVTLRVFRIFTFLVEINDLDL